jgi:carboxymethylenebutenolidase
MRGDKKMMPALIRKSKKGDLPAIFARVGKFFLLLFSLGASAIVHAAAIESEEVAYHGDVKGYYAAPAGGDKYPGVILIHEWWGLNEDIRAKARDFAEQGYAALAVDLYGVEATTDREKARELAGKVRGDTAAAFANLKDAISFLSKRAEVDGGRLASVGWCFGGGWSYQIAKNDLGVGASVIYYGAFNPDDDLQKMRAAILGHFAEKDRVIKIDRVREFAAKLKTPGGAHEVFIYPNTHHGFANPANPKHDKKAAALARERTFDFLRRALN